MLNAVLAATVIWCLFFGRIAILPLAILSIGAGAVLLVCGRHSHTGYPVIDVLAQSSRLNSVHPGLKFWSVLALMVLCACAPNPAVGILLAAVLPVLTVWVGGLALRDYIRLLALPVTFLLLSGLALLFEVAGTPTGVLNIRLFHFWLCVTAETQATTALVMARAVGAVSCLYLLSLSTPMPEIIGVLERARCPHVVINLMYLIYRYLFILLSMYDTMEDATESRLGYGGYRAGLRTTGSIYSSLLARSYRQAGRNYDAMESRCMGGEIRFLQGKQRMRGAHVAVAAGAVLLVLATSLFFR